MARNVNWQLILLLLTASVVSFWSWTPITFVGDDLSAYISFQEGGFASSWHGSLFGVFADKYRPVSQAISGALLGLFGQHYPPYLIATYAIHTASGYALFAICRRLSGIYVLSAVAGVVFVALRFGYLNTTLIGLVESIPMLFCLLAVLVSVRILGAGSWQVQPRPVDVYLLILFISLAIFSHERYLAMVPWAIAVILFSKIQSKFVFVSLAVVPVVIYVGYKAVILGSPIMVGTGGASLGVDLGRILEHARQITLTLLGINTGPEYLSGVQVQSPAQLAFWPVPFFILSASALFVQAFRISMRSLVWPALTIFLAACLLAPALLTIRVEQRWLLTSTGLMLTVLFWCAGQLPRDSARKGAVLLTIALSSYSLVDRLLATSYGDMFFIKSVWLGNAFVSSEGVARVNGRLNLIVNEESQCTWVLQGGKILRQYGRSETDMHCYLSVDDFVSDQSATGPGYVYHALSRSLIRLNITE